MEAVQRESAELVTITKTGIVNVNKIIIHDLGAHNWHTQLVHGSTLFTRTDQDVHYQDEDNPYRYTEQSIDRFSRVYYNGVLIVEDGYAVGNKKPWWKKLFSF
jgi:hypothetical protein